MEEIKEKVKKLGLEDCVKFLGQRNDVNELYQVFDVFCLPSLYEGLPVVGIEAQATGLLCVLSDDMTKETKVLNETEFLSLKQSADIWAKIILNKQLILLDKNNTAKKKIAVGYDINNESFKLEKIYKKLIKTDGEKI